MFQMIIAVCVGTLVEHAIEAAIGFGKKQIKKKRRGKRNAKEESICDATASA
jgi:hypothetical protein